VSGAAPRNTPSQSIAPPRPLQGFIEGALTAARIAQHYNNTNAWVVSQFKGGVVPPAIINFFSAQDAWMRAGIAANASADPTWAAVGAVVAQFDGLVAGYAATNPPLPLSVYQFEQMNAMGDLLDLIPAVSPGDTWDWANMTDDQLMARVRATTHCSSLIKVTGDFSDLFFGHSAWFIFQSTNRIYKSYSFPLSGGFVGTEMSFSSYPAYLSSLDDYYAIWSSGIAVTETTNSIFNMSLYKLVVPQSLFAWHRVRAANLLATTGAQWAAVFSEYNSGTYNNQYMVVEVGKFTPKAALPPGILTVVEQIPGLVVSGDKTDYLVSGHWPSYNVPFFPAIYNASGYTQVMAARRPDGQPLGELAGIDYQLAPRAKIFRRDAGKVSDLDSYLSILRYNDYKNDPYATSPWDAICSRGDLAGSPDGCLDTKGSSASFWASKTSFVINGPTTGSMPPGGSLPPFAWTQFPNTPHEGLPPVYDFMFEAVTPEWA
jgi:hypothetical protein